MPNLYLKNFPQRLFDATKEKWHVLSYIPFQLFKVAYLLDKISKLKTIINLHRLEFSLNAIYESF